MKYLKIFIITNILLVIVGFMILMTIGKYAAPRQDPLPSDFPELRNPVYQFAIGLICAFGAVLFGPALTILFKLQLWFHIDIGPDHLGMWFWLILVISLSSGFITLVIFLYDLYDRLLSSSKTKKSKQQDD